MDRSHRSFSREVQKQVHAERRSYFKLHKRKIPTDQDNSSPSTPEPQLATTSATSTSPPTTIPSTKHVKSNDTALKAMAPLIVRFYDPQEHAKDANGRTLEQILSWPDSKLESCHNYIQMLFPVPEGSAFSWEAPIINRETMDAFRSRSELRESLRRSFKRMLSFYGFEVAHQARSTQDATPSLAPGAPSNNVASLEYHIVRSSDWEVCFKNWVHRSDHNHLRISRILRCLRILGLQKECDAFFAALKEVYKDPKLNIGDTSMDFWTRAATRALYLAPDNQRIGWLKEWEEEQEAAKVSKEDGEETKKVEDEGKKAAEEEEKA